MAIDESSEDVYPKREFIKGDMTAIFTWKS